MRQPATDVDAMILALEAIRAERYGAAEGILANALTHTVLEASKTINKIASRIEEKFNEHRHPELYSLAVWVRSLEK
jgi:predicted HD phosphohydrolase